MRIGIITLLVTVYVSFTRLALCQDQPSGPLSGALRFFDQAASTDIDSTLRGVRKGPLSGEERDLTRAMLHREKALVPTAAEVKKLDALKPILIYHERDHAFDIEVMDVPQAFIGLRARVILVISRPALKVLTASELQALAAHEIAHEFLWATFDEIPPGRARQELELKCDGIAALTLLTLGLDPMGIIDAVKKLEGFNQRFSVAPNATDYPTLHDRKQLVTTLINRPWAAKAMISGVLRPIEVRASDERRLRIELVVFRLRESQADMVRREVEAIWAAQAVRIEWSPVGTAGCVRVLIDRPASMLPPVAPTERWTVAASRVVEEKVLPLMYVSVDAAERVVRAASPPYSAPELAGIMVPRVLGRAIAHELAHVLLDTRAHARQGLLRASFTANEFVDPGRDGFNLDHEQLARARQHDLLVTTLQ